MTRRLSPKVGAAVRIGSAMGFIDKQGRYVINPQFKDAFNFTEGLAAVQAGQRWGFVGGDGTFVMAPQFEEVFNFSEGRAAVLMGAGGLSKKRQLPDHPLLRSGFYLLRRFGSR